MKPILAAFADWFWAKKTVENGRPDFLAIGTTASKISAAGPAVTPTLSFPVFHTPKRRKAPRALFLGRFTFKKP